MPKGKRVLLPGIDLHDLPLSIKELKFVADIAENGVGDLPGSYARAGFNPSTNKHKTRALALRLLEKPEVHQAIKRISESVLDPYKERIRLRLMELWEARAFWDPRDYFKENHDIKELHEIPDRAILAIDGIRVDYKGKDADRRVVNFDMANRSEAGKILETFVKTGEGTKLTLPEENVKKVKDRLAAVKEAAARGGQVKRVVEKTTETISFGDETEETQHETEPQGG